MERTDLVTLIATAIRDFALASPHMDVSAIDEATRLFGAGGLLDSLGLVTVVLDVEQEVNARLSTSITVADDRAMSQSRSPFRTVGSLADYITMLTREQKLS